MYRTFLALVAALIFATTPAFADKLIFLPGQEVSTWIHIGPNPNGLPEGAVLKDWVPVNGDTDPHNYKLVNGEITHAPVVVDVVPEPADTPKWELFKTEVFLDPSISIVARLELSKLFPLMDSNIRNPVYIQQYWGALKQLAPVVPTHAWLDTDTITKVEAHATERHIPFNP